MLRTRLIAGAVSGFVLSAVAATLLTFIGFCETFFEPLRVDPGQPAPAVLRLPHGFGGGPHGGLDARHTGAVLIRRGEVVTDPGIAQRVRAYENARRPPEPSQLAAYWLVHLLVMMTMTTYLRNGRARQSVLLRTQVGLVVLALLFVVANKAFLLFVPRSEYFVPIALVPLWASFYLDRRTGMLMSGVMTVLAASLVHYDPIVCAAYLSSCAAGALYMKERKYSGNLLSAGVVAGMGGAIVYAAASQIFGQLSVAGEIAAAWESGPAALVIASIGAGLLAFLLRPVVARLLGVLSRGQLLNLTDLDQPLLRKMAAEAPGSWEHSRAMANLAEAAAASIHADALLTRTGAYYHDLGKTCQAKYYVENLGPGERSPHEELEPEVSADAIMAHVIEGVRILREGGIPEPVVEFVYTHHGTTVIEYFWHKCQRLGNPKALTEEAFRYPGMPPRTKETAILMLIDSIEAGARTVDPPSHEAFSELVRRVIFTKLGQGQLDESGLTLEDLRILTNQIADTLVSVHHSRIRYPWQEKEREAQAQATVEAAEAGQEVEDRRSPAPAETEPPAPADRTEDGQRG